MNYRILIIEDDLKIKSIIEDLLTQEGYETESVTSLQAARNVLQDNFYHLILSDLKLPDGDSTEILESFNQKKIPIIIMTAFGTVEQAVNALKNGAEDFITKPINFEHLFFIINKVIKNNELKKEVEFYKERYKDHFHGIITRSKRMHSLINEIKMIAPTSSHALIMGESGTGKELIAKAIHYESHFSNGKFVPLNCAGFPSELLESELFGHKKGAFTGANDDREGLFSHAHNGTLFLDEIGEMPIDLQAKLLRVLEDKKIKRVGDNNEKAVNVRVIAATNKDLEREVQKGNFREDLFFRLETFTLIPAPLRYRDEDLELLTHHFINHYAKEREKSIKGIDIDALEALKSYRFPGNVRELLNIIDRAVTFCQEDLIKLKHLPQRVKEIINKKPKSLDEVFSLSNLHTLEEVEIKYILHVLDLVEGNKKKAASLLGIGRKTIYRKLETIKA